MLVSAAYVEYRQSRMWKSFAPSSVLRSTGFVVTSIFLVVFREDGAG